MTILRLHETDNVVVALKPLAKGFAFEDIQVQASVPSGHKVAARAIAEREPIVKFGQIIGFASEPIAAGSHVHTQNCRYADFDRMPKAGEKPAHLLSKLEARSFQGFRRANGRAGTRNYLGILTSVNCSASVARFVAEAVNRSGILQDFPHVDGVIALTHGGGCALDTEGEGYEILKRTQWGYATNPNMGGVLLLGLGCEGFQIRRFMHDYGISDSETFRSFTIQERGGTRKAVEAGLEAVKAMLPHVDAARRVAVPVSDLCLALQCGGSDGYSGITANPALGVAVDLLSAHGGTAILSETPEIYGAEHLLMARAREPAIAAKLGSIIDWWRDYAARNKASMDNNPSPGNKAGGLTTILEKSLGAVAKGGTGPLNGVYHYAEPVREAGLVFMDTPGYDPVSATGQVAGGANLIAFTTGRGSAYGCKPVPSLKLATNSAIYAHMIDDMDINCGDVLEGVSLEAKGREIFETLIRVASGERTKSEAFGYGDAEFVPWPLGAVM